MVMTILVGQFYGKTNITGQLVMVTMTITNGQLDGQDHYSRSVRLSRPF